MVSEVKSTYHFEWIDFLRGISAFGVVLFHVRVDLWVGWLAISSTPNKYSLFDRSVAFLSLPMPFLGSAVMMFFLVSGFCIHYPYAASGRELKLKSYSIRRFLRIYPPYLAVVILSVLIDWATSFGGHSSSTLPKVIQTVFMLQNYGPQASQIASNPSLWSLPIEVELYFFYPLFYWLLISTRMKLAMILVAGVSLAAMGLFLLGNSWILGNFAIYWIIWCAGALLAEWTRRNKLPKWQPWYSLVMASAFLMAIAANYLKLNEAIQHLLWGGAYFTMILWGLAHPHPLRILGTRMKKMFLSLGLISYSLYLVHFPFFKLCGAVWVVTFGTKPANLLIPLAFSILSIPIAYIFYWFFEAPSHRLARRIATTKKAI